MNAHTYTKTVLIVLILITGMAFSLYAQDAGGRSEYVWGSYYNPGNLILGASARLDTGDGYVGLASSPSAEIILSKPAGPFDIGAQLVSRVGFALTGPEGTGPGLGVGLLATGRLGFRGFDLVTLEALQRLDLYAGLGIGVDFARYPGEPSPTLNIPLSFVGRTGVSYYLDDRLSVFVGTTQWNVTTGAEIGVRYRMGSTPVVTGGIGDAAAATQASIYLGSYFFAVPVPFIDTWYHDYATYEVGQGTVWEFTSTDYEDVITVERAVLSRDAAGAEWRSYRWMVPEEDQTDSTGDELYFELRVNADGSWDRMLFVDLFTGRPAEYVFEDGEGDEAVLSLLEQEALQGSTPEEQGVRVESRGMEQHTVAAGTYEAEYLALVDVSDSPEEFEIEFYLADNAPGQLIRTIMTGTEDGEPYRFEGELVQITNGNGRRF
ncbi:MAG: hypothetical protein ACOC4I_01625 [Spirochaetota bacterium]